MQPICLFPDPQPCMCVCDCECAWVFACAQGRAALHACWFGGPAVGAAAARGRLGQAGSWAQHTRTAAGGGQGHDSGEAPPGRNVLQRHSLYIIVLHSSHLPCPHVPCDPFLCPPRPPHLCRQIGRSWRRQQVEQRPSWSTRHRWEGQAQVGGAGTGGRGRHRWALTPSCVYPALMPSCVYPALMPSYVFPALMPSRVYPALSPPLCSVWQRSTALCRKSCGRRPRSTD